MITTFRSVLLKISRRKLFRKRLSRGMDHSNLFGNFYLDGKNLYLQEFGIIPNSIWVNQVDIDRCLEYIQSRARANGDMKILDIYRSSFFEKGKGSPEFGKGIIVLNDRVMIELANKNAQIYYPLAKAEFAETLLMELSEFQAPGKDEPLEMEIIISTSYGLELKSLEIKPVDLDIGLFYNDDFGEIDELIRTRLSGEKEKGIVLLHGVPGTGKTTYLRHLIGGLQKKVLFISPAIAGNLANPELVDILIDNPNSVLVIEDAENIIMDRKLGSGSAVSNLLNISDGLLSDCLNVQVICTFNSPLTMVDSALLRKGRLIARYEFGKLEPAKAQKLSDHLGFSTKIARAMTIAEVAHQNDADYLAVGRPEGIGFRQRVEEQRAIPEIGIRMKAEEMEQ